MLEWTVPYILIYGVYWLFKDVIHSFIDEPENDKKVNQFDGISSDELKERRSILLRAGLSSEHCTEINIELKKREEKKLQEKADEDDQRLKMYRHIKREYMQSPDWKEKRKEQLKYDNYTCQLCDAHNCVLDVHHCTYVNLFNEKNKDLKSLCRTCHDSVHREFGFPDSIEDYEKKYYWQI